MSAISSVAILGAYTSSLAWGTIVISLGAFLFRKWMQGPRFSANVNLDGRTVVITGANTGIGKICAKEMSKRGAKVVILCRNLEKAESAASEIRQETRGEVIVEKLDLSSLDSVRKCAGQLNDRLDKIDILLNNAGIMTCPEMRTAEGFEMQIGTNHFGHFLLTNLLLPLLRKAAPGARIVNVSSLAHESGKMFWEDINYNKRPYRSMEAYCQSKLANVLFTKELARQLGGTGISAYALHPGVINTELFRHGQETFGFVFGWITQLGLYFMKTPEAGAQTSLFCCMDPTIADQTGKYYSDCREKKPGARALKSDDAQRLWSISEELTGLRK